MEIKTDKERKISGMVAKIGRKKIKLNAKMRSGTGRKRRGGQDRGQGQKKKKKK